MALDRKAQHEIKNLDWMGKIYDNFSCSTKKNFFSGVV